MPTSPDSATVVIQATPDIQVIAETPEVVVVGAAEPGEVVILAASTVAGPQGPPGEDTADILLEHVNADEPHPAYDNGPDLSLIYENAKV
jgi:hypothetical protein